MNHETIERLNRLNLEFYSRHADDFSRTREGPWPGWGTVLRTLTPAHGRRLSVLDAGCGNGRFARYLAGRLGAPFDYTGIDSSEVLLEHARSRLAGIDSGSDGSSRSRFNFFRVDLLDEASGSYRLAGAGYDLVAAFGLTHHIPGLERRRSLLAELGRLLRPGGLLAVAFWQFADSVRFQRRMVSWEEFNATADESVDIGQLETGDHLLTWGQRSRAVRYCHHSDDREVEELISGLGLESAGRFRSAAEIDRLNLYQLLRRP